MSSAKTLAVSRDLTPAYVAARLLRQGSNACAAAPQVETAKAPFRPQESKGRASGGALELTDLSAKVDSTWFSAAQDARKKLADVAQKIAQLSKAHQRRQKRVFEEDDSEVIDASRALALALRAGEVAVTALGQIRTKKATKQDLEIRQNLQRKFAAQLQNLSSQARQVQKAHLAVMRRRQGSAHLQEEDIDLGRAKINVGLLELEVVEIEDLEAATLDQRCQEIRRLATSVNDLHTIYKDLAAMVIDQGSVLDRIDYNIEQVVEHTKQARGQLEQAEEVQKKGRATRCMMILALADVILLVLLVLKHQRRG